MDINKLIEEVKQSRPMTEKQTMELLNKLKIPKNYSFTRAEVADMLDAPSLPNPLDAKKKESTAKTGIRTVKAEKLKCQKKSIMHQEQNYLKPQWQEERLQRNTKLKMPRHFNAIILHMNEIKMSQYLTKIFHPFQQLYTRHLNDKSI